MEKCYENLIKYFVFLCNLLFALAGACLVGFGAFVQINANDFKEFVGSSYVIISTFVIVVGLITFFISFLGCCGSCNENSCLVYTYSVLLLIILLAQFGAGIAALVLRSDLGSSIGKGMKDAMGRYGEQEAATGAWDIVQSEFHCCGLSNSSDWRGEAGFCEGNLPLTCCRTSTTVDMNGSERTDKLSFLSKPVDTCTSDMDQVYPIGCLGAVESFLANNINIIGVVVLVFGLVEVVGLVLACCLGDRIHRANHYHRFD